MPRDGRLHLRELGSGPALLMLHGFTGSSAAWGDALLGSLAQSFRVLAVDLLGHGASPRPDDPARYGLPRQVDQLCEVLAARDCERAVWCGYSMGGRLALAAALERPECVRALVLEGASPGLAQPEERRARQASDEQLARRLEQHGIDQFVDGWMAQPLFASQARRLGAEAVQRERVRRLRNDPAALAASLRGAGSGAQPSYWERLSEVRVPALLIAGAEDEKFRAIAGAMAHALPEATVETIPEAGHTTHLERPEHYRDAVLRFARRTLEGSP